MKQEDVLNAVVRMMMREAEVRGKMDLAKTEAIVGAVEVRKSQFIQ